jgi:hypothetical protein
MKLLDEMTITKYRPKKLSKAKVLDRIWEIQNNLVRHSITVVETGLFFKKIIVTVEAVDNNHDTRRFECRDYNDILIFLLGIEITINDVTMRGWI